MARVGRARWCVGALGALGARVGLTAIHIDGTLVRAQISLQYGARWCVGALAQWIARAQSQDRYILR